MTTKTISATREQNVWQNLRSIIQRIIDKSNLDPCKFKAAKKEKYANDVNLTVVVQIPKTYPDAG